MSKLKFFVIIGCLFCLLMVFKNAAATCNSYPTGIPQILNFGTISVQANAPNGTHLGGATASQLYTPGHNSVNCTNTTEVLALGSWNQPSGVIVANQPVYKTSIPGVGIQIAINTLNGVGVTGNNCSSWQGNSFGLLVPQTVRNNCASGLNGGTLAYYKFSASLYKIGTITTTTCTPGTTLGSDSVDGHQLFAAQLGTCSIKVIAPPIPTCSMNTGDANKSILLQPVPSSAFASSTTAGAQNFSIGVRGCANATSATFSFAGTQDTTNPVMFRNTSTTQPAKGIALQLTSTSDKKTIGANGTTNTRTVNITNSQASLPLTVQYYKVGSSVIAGNVKAVASVTMTYR